VATSGGQPGNQNALKAKRWQQAIDRALAKRCKGDGIAALDELAEQYIDAIARGDKDFMPGFNSLADRLDGKPAQAIALDADVRLNDVTHRIVRERESK
jgi:hypothetical protein